jgi:hypothetical protein
MARKATSKPAASTATIGFEATALRCRANPQRAAILRSPQGNRWLTADTALRGSAFLQIGGTLQVMAERQDNFRKDDDVRWQFGVPPMTALRGSAFPQTEGTPQVASEARDNNANFAWVQHFIHHLAPHGMAGFVLANGSMSSNQSGEGTFESALGMKTSSLSQRATA